MDLHWQYLCTAIRLFFRLNIVKNIMNILCREDFAFRSLFNRVIGVDCKVTHPDRERERERNRELNIVSKKIYIPQQENNLTANIT